MARQDKDILVISFDLDGTLITREYVDYFWYELVPRLYAKRYGVSMNDAKRIVYAEYDGIGPGDVRWYLPGYWFKRFEIEDHLLDALREASERIRPYEDVVDVVEKLKEKYTLIICTGAAREFINMVLAKIKQYSSSFRYIFSSSSDFGLPGKPPTFYRIVVERLGVMPSQVLHIGDDPVSDYRNAIEAGLRAVLVDRRSNGSLRDSIERVLGSL